MDEGTGEGAGGGTAWPGTNEGALGDRAEAEPLRAVLAGSGMIKRFGELILARVDVSEEERKRAREI